MLGVCQEGNHTPIVLHERVTLPSVKLERDSNQSLGRAILGWTGDESQWRNGSPVDREGAQNTIHSSLRVSPGRLVWLYKPSSLRDLQSSNTRDLFSQSNLPYVHMTLIIFVLGVYQYYLHEN